MATTFNDLSDAELGRLLRSRYDRLCQAHDMGLSDQHPSERWAEDTEVLKAHRAACDEGGGLGPVLNMKRGAQDNPPATPGTPKPPAQDGKFERGTDGVAR